MTTNNRLRLRISRIGLTLLYLVWLPLVTSAATPISRPEQASVIHQPRIYEIFENNKRAFHDRFRDHAMRIMAKYDFNIVAMWEAKNGARTEFIYILEWPDEQTMKDRWAKFMADQDWSAIKKESAARYGNLVGEIQDRTLHVTAYSPRKEFAARE